jgi:PAS domain S-box-containing protein
LEGRRIVIEHLRTTRSLRARLGTGALIAVAYVIAAHVGFLAAGSNDAVTAVWPPTGIAVAAVLLCGGRVWPGIALGAFAANATNGSPLYLAALIAVGNTLAPLVAGAILHRFDLRPTLDRFRDVVVLTIGGMSAMTVSATLGTASLFITGHGITTDTWILWWVGDAMGVVLVTPFLLTLMANDGLLRARWRQACVLIGTLAAATSLAVVTDSPVGYAVVPLAMAIAVQLEQQGAAIAALTMSAIDLGFMVATQNASARLDNDLAAMQGINATIAFILFALAAIMHERRRAQRTLEAAASELEQRVVERTAALVLANERLEREIQERSHAEERLSKAQRLAHIGSFQWDAATDRNDWTEELYRIYGLDPAGDPPRFDEYIAFIRSDVRADVRASIEKGIAAGEALSHEYPVVLRDGRKKWVHAYIEVMHDENGSLAGLRGTCQDVTDRKVAEAALRWSEGRFRALLESAPDAVIVVDSRGKIVLSNKQTANLLGYDREELLGRSVEMLLPLEHQETHVDHRDRYNAQPASRPMGAGNDLYAVRKDGTSVAVDISLSPVETDNGFLVFALVRDASQRRHVEDTLRTTLDRERQAVEDLRKLDRAKNAFLSAVSHELRTPLTAILGFAEVLEDPTIRSSVELTTDLVERISLSANRLNHLLIDLLDLDRLHRGIVTPRRRATDLRGLVGRALIALDIGNHPLTLDVEDATVLVDPAQAERIIENLLSNAVRYTPAGTAIHLRARTSTSQGVDLFVEDAGPGVPEELWSTIFEPFVRADSGTFTQGTGIGLSLVDRFARLHGGIAEVGHRPGGGARFSVLLPGPHEPDEGSGDAEPTEHTAVA